MNNLKCIIVFCSSALFLTGCSNSSVAEPKYDEVELINYQACMNDTDNYKYYIGRLSWCEQFKPIKK